MPFNFQILAPYFEIKDFISETNGSGLDFYNHGLNWLHLSIAAILFYGRTRTIVYGVEHTIHVHLWWFE